MAGFPFCDPRLSLFTAAVIILLAGSACAPAPSVPTAGPEPSEILRTTAGPTTTVPGAAPATTPPPTPTAAPKARPSTAACQSAGWIETGSLDSTSLPRPLDYRIYLPPCYENHAVAYYPTLYLLHGLAADNSQWTGLGMVGAADELMSTGELPHFLIVMPWERTGLELDPAVPRALLPHIEGRYRARPGRAWRAIGGLSRGAGWAFRIAFRHPELFSAAGLHSPALFAGDLVALEGWLEDAPNGAVPDAWIDIGDRDPLGSATEELTDRLDTLGVEYEYHAGVGRHEAEYWSGQVEAYLRWYAARWSGGAADPR